jgi:hypothetical protein
MAGPPPDAFRELVRAHAFAALRTLPPEERASWAERAAALSGELHVDSLVPSDGGSALVWRLTMESLSRLRSAFRDAPGWLKSRYAEEERRRLAAYAERHVDVLVATTAREPPG